MKNQETGQKLLNQVKTNQKKLKMKILKNLFIALLNPRTSNL